MLVKPEFLSIAYGGFRRALLEWRSGKNNVKQVEEKPKAALFPWDLSWNYGRCLRTRRQPVFGVATELEN